MELWSKNEYLKSRFLATFTTLSDLVRINASWGLPTCNSFSSESFSFSYKLALVTSSLGAIFFTKSKKFETIMMSFVFSISIKLSEIYYNFLNKKDFVVARLLALELAKAFLSRFYSYSSEV